MDDPHGEQDHGCPHEPQHRRRRRDARYGTAYNAGEFLRTANDAVWALPLIEGVDAIDALDEILGVPGVRAFFSDPGDMGLSRLTPQEPQADPVERLMDRAVATGVRKGKVVATVAGSPAAAAALARRAWGPARSNPVGLR